MLTNPCAQSVPALGWWSLLQPCLARRGPWASGLELLRADWASPWSFLKTAGSRQSGFVVPPGPLPLRGTAGVPWPGPSFPVDSTGGARPSILISQTSETSDAPLAPPLRQQGA